MTPKTRDNPTPRGKATDKPAVTRIGQPTEEMGKLATKLLFECISSGERSTTQIELSPTLITGASVGTPTSQ